MSGEHHPVVSHPDPPRVIPEGSIIITPEQVYGEVKVLTDKVTVLLAKSEAEDLPGRVRRLEQRVWAASGGAAVIGALVGALAPSLIR